MALVSTSGPSGNIESDVALADAASLSITRAPTGQAVNIVSISLGPINAASTNTCGKVSLKNDTTVIWTGYVFFVASATTQSQSQTWPLGIAVVPTGAGLSVLYTNITNASTASVNLIWRCGS